MLRWRSRAVLAALGALAVLLGLGCLPAAAQHDGVAPGMAAHLASVPAASIPAAVTHDADGLPPGAQPARVPAAAAHDAGSSPGASVAPPSVPSLVGGPSLRHPVIEPGAATPADAGRCCPGDTGPDVAAPTGGSPTQSGQAAVAEPCGAHLPPDAWRDAPSSGGAETRIAPTPPPWARGISRT